ncbi:NifU family protein [bacterium]|nr:NifU family protein [bacterium]
MITVISIEPTPNPNALKFIVSESFVPNGATVTYNSSRDAGVDPLGAGLFRIQGVTSVFYMDDFITVTKSGDVPWEDIVEEAEGLIGSTAPVLVDLGPMSDPSAAASAAPAADGIAFDAMSAEERLGRINQILDDEIRPALAGDGGGLQVLGIAGDRVRVHYQGACGSCPTSTAGTLMYIETRLRELLSGKLTLSPE